VRVDVGFCLGLMVGLERIQDGEEGAGHIQGWTGLGADVYRTGRGLFYKQKGVKGEKDWAGLDWTGLTLRASDQAKTDPPSPEPTPQPQPFALLFGISSTTFYFALRLAFFPFVLLTFSSSLLSVRAPFL
jgi:hypothetical protein